MYVLVKGVIYDLIEDHKKHSNLREVKGCRRLPFKGNIQLKEKEKRKKNTQLNSSKNHFYKLVERSTRIIDLNALIL